MNKIYISDLDGTLLRNNATLSDYSRKKLCRLFEDGVKFTVASARAIYSIKQILGNLPIELPVIEFNGAYITDFKTGEHLIINDIPRDMSFAFMEIIEEHNCIPFISTFDGKKNNLYYKETNNLGMQWYLNNRVKAKDKRLKQVDNLKKVINENVVCFTVINKEEKLLKLTEYLTKKYSDIIEVHLIENQYSPGWHWLTIHDKKATKDQAIQALLKLENLHEYETVVFGDNLNDLKMFKGADRSIAVENAKDELKKYATEIIGKNEDDSVVNFIMQDVYESEMKLQGAY